MWIKLQQDLKQQFSVRFKRYPPPRSLFQKNGRPEKKKQFNSD